MNSKTHLLQQRPSTWPQVRVGLTMVELLVAITLAVMLMSAMTGLLRSLQQPLRIAEQLDTPLWPAGLEASIRRDLQTATSVHRQGEIIWLTGTLASNAGTPTKASSSYIGYTCIPISEQHPGLVRLDASGAELIALGPRRLVLERIDDSGAPQPLPPIAGPIPRQLRLWVYGVDAQTPLIVRDIVLW